MEHPFQRSLTPKNNRQHGVNMKLLLQDDVLSDLKFKMRLFSLGIDMKESIIIFGIDFLMKL